MPVYMVEQETADLPIKINFGDHLLKNTNNFCDDEITHNNIYQCSWYPGLYSTVRHHNLFGRNPPRAIPPTGTVFYQVSTGVLCYALQASFATCPSFHSNNRKRTCKPSKIDTYAKCSHIITQILLIVEQRGFKDSFTKYLWRFTHFAKKFRGNQSQRQG